MQNKANNTEQCFIRANAYAFGKWRPHPQSDISFVENTAETVRGTYKSLEIL